MSKKFYYRDWVTRWIGLYLKSMDVCFYIPSHWFKDFANGTPTASGKLT